MDLTQAVGDILVLPFFGQGHIFPCVELCKHLSSLDCKSIFIIPSHLSSSIPSTLHHHPLIEVLLIPVSYSSLPPPPPPEKLTPPPNLPAGQGTGSEIGPRTLPVSSHHKELGEGIESFLTNRYKNGPGRIRPGCVVMDVMMSWSKEIFMKENIPVVSFITSGACCTAVEYAAWKARAGDMQPGETRMLPGLPESLALSYSDLTQQDHRHQSRGSDKRGLTRPVGPPGGMNFGPRRPGQPPRWLDDLEGWTAVMLNTCDDLEGQFLEYLARQIGKPVLGVGPLLPEKYWNSIGLVIHDRDSRLVRESNYKEDEIVQWMDSKPSHSVIYVSFGSEVGPTMEEYAQLGDALAESNQSFIWVIQPGAGKQGPPANLFGGKSGSPNDKEGGYYPHGLKEKVVDKGLIVKGWAPQLLILSHPSAGGFLSHCGWNSTVEAIGRGVPILAWPIRGDQFYIANLVVKHLKSGHTVLNGEDSSEMVKKSDITRGIEMLMDDKEVHNRAKSLKDIFEGGYPSSSMASLKTLIELISK